jgi:hypothetical protein
LISKGVHPHPSVSADIAELSRASRLRYFALVACERCRNNVIDGQSSCAFDEPADSQAIANPISDIWLAL